MTEPTAIPFMEKFQAWKEFEKLVKALHEGDGECVVQHDVTLVGKSEAKRQIDVLVTRSTQLYEYTTIVECKRLKERVTRQRIDILKATVDDLNASKGAIYTTVGYERGANQYAKHNGIDIYVIRDLVDKEWGLPGRLISLHLHYYHGHLDRLNFPNAKLATPDGKAPPKMALDFALAKNMVPTEEQLLRSRRNGRKGPAITDMVVKAYLPLMKAITSHIPVLNDGEKGVSLLIDTPVCIDFSDFEFNLLRLPAGVVFIDKVTFTLRIHVLQSAINYDRGDRFDFCLAVEKWDEDYQLVALQMKGEDEVKFARQIPKPEASDSDAREGDVLTNGSLMKLTLSLWVKSGIRGNEAKCQSNPVVVKPILVEEELDFTLDALPPHHQVPEFDNIISTGNVSSPTASEQTQESQDKT